MSPSLRHGMVAAAVLLALSGGALLVLGLKARRSLNPSAVEASGTTFRVVRRVEPRAVVFDLIHPDGSVAISISGSTDTLCDPPYLMLLDADHDGAQDVYYRHCGGHGYVTWRNGGWVDVDLGQYDADDMPASASSRAREIHAGGWRLLALGATGALLGLAIVAVLLSAGSLERRAPGG
jgi:hypothetical protein